MGAFRVDAFDLRLMAVIAREGRASFRELSKRVNLSDAACRMRLRALESAGLIEGYGAHIAYDRLGAFSAWADVTLRDERASAFARFEALALADPNVAGVWVLAGEAHVRLLVLAADYDGWLAFTTRMSAASDMVREVKGTPIYKACRPGPLFPERVLSDMLIGRMTADI